MKNMLLESLVLDGDNNSNGPHTVTHDTNVRHAYVLCSILVLGNTKLKPTNWMAAKIHIITHLATVLEREEKSIWIVDNVLSYMDSSMKFDEKG